MSKICEKHGCEKRYSETMLKAKLRPSWSCQQCKIEYDIEYRKKNKKKRQEQQAEYYEQNKNVLLNKRKQYYEENKTNILKQKQEYCVKNKSARKKQAQEYYQEHRAEILNRVKNYTTTNIESIRIYLSEYYQSHSEELRAKSKENYQENKERILSRARVYQKNRRSADPIFRLHGNVSLSIRRELKNNGVSKNNKSIITYLPYSIQELKKYLETLFEPWMTWENWGKYDLATWDNNDSTTWTWQIDHVIPHSKFHYTSMEDQAFKDCWALTNLRPYSAKQNVIDGSRSRC